MSEPRRRVARPSLDPEQLKRLYVRGDLRPALEIVATFGAIAAVFAAYIVYPIWPVVVGGVVLIGGLQHRLSIIQHEANHYLLFTSRGLNELGGAFTAWPIGFTMRYRGVHLKHHQALGAEADPDLYNYRDYPLGPKPFALDLLLNLSGFAAATQFMRQSRGDTSGSHRGFDRGLFGVVAAQAGVAGALYALGRPEAYALLWLVPLVTVTKTLTHFRNVVEHVQLRDVGDPELSRYRTIHCNPVERFLFAPLGFNYHAEHHFYPAIPYHHLREAHQLLAQHPAYDQAVEVDRGYVRTLLGRAVRREGP